MKHRIILLFLCVSILTHGQRKASSKPISLDIDSNGLISVINYVDGSLQFVDEDGNNTIDANESCQIIFKITNIGDGNGSGCVARISVTGANNGLSYANFNIPQINKGETKEVVFNIKANDKTVNGIANFQLEIYEPHNLGTGLISYNIPTHQFEAPQVEVVSYQLLSESSRLERKKNFKMLVMIQNLDQGIAENVKVRINKPADLVLVSSNEEVKISSLMPNEKKTIEFEFVGTMAIKDSVNCEIKLSEKYGKYAKDATIPLNFGEKSTITGMLTSTRGGNVEIQKGSLISDVDQNIPMSKTKAYNTYALIIANENYTSAPNVSYAINDGKSFRDYCIKTLGVPESNIQYVTNATGNTLKAQINQLQNNIRILNGQAKIIVYYAGHGIPDDVHGNGNAYLLPVDGMANDPTTAYKLDDLYAALGEYETQGITIFIDACFSGGTRDINKTVYGDVRGVAVRVKRGQPQGNMVVFSAAQNNQTANSYPDQQHGLFTYYLLKKLKEEKGEISLNDLSEAVIKAVRLESNRHNAYQEPCIIASPTADANWRNWKLK